MKSFVRSWAIVAVAAFALAAAAAPSFAGIVYTMTDASDLQDGWALSGTITVSGVGTNLGSGDITGWAYTVSKNGVSYTYSSNDSTPYTNAFGLLATPTYLIVPYNEESAVNGNSLDLILQGPTGGMSWATAFNSSPSTYYGMDFTTGGPEMMFWDQQNLTFPLEATEGWVIGTASSSAVPEIDPATGASALSLVAGVLAMVEERRRRGLKAVLAG